MTTQDLDPSADAEQQAPPSQGDSEGSEQAVPEQDENERERELQRRLTQQGRETAEARRAAAYAQNQATVLTSTVQELQSQVTLLTAHLGEQQRADQQRQQQELDNYLATLPPEERLDRKIQILGEQVKQLQTAATPSRPVQQQPAPQAAPQPQASSDDATLQYMKDRAIAIVNEAEAEFGVKVDVSQLSDGDWETEEAFYKAVMRRAARGNGEAMPKKTPATETPQQMQARIRREVEESLGVSSPNGPKPAAARAHKPTEDDVKSMVNGYSSAKGPKAQVQKLREMRERMG